MRPRFNLTYDPAYDEDLSRIDAFAFPFIRTAVANLAHQCEVVTRNRRPLAKTVSWCPQATWQMRVSGFRVLYRVEADTIRILRVKFKGTTTTEDMGS